VRRWKRGEWKRLKVERQKVWKFCGSLGGGGERKRKRKWRESRVTE
jgi:hypothetical protein